MRGLIERLESLPWDAPGDAIRSAANLLSDVSWEHVQDFLDSWNDPKLDQCAWESHETSTHFKWLLHRGSDDAFQVWLHEYKSPSLLRDGYADSIHDHRYWFASKILSGGFTQSSYRMSENQDGGCDAAEIGKISFDAGSVYVVDPDEIHAISDFKHPTLTLLVRSRATKPFSTEIRAREGRAVRYYPLRTRIRSLRGGPDSRQNKN